MTITFDLDGVIFDIESVYKEAFRIKGIPYRPLGHWNIYKACTKQVADAMIELFKSDMIYQTPLINANIPQALNELLQDKKYDVKFVTERLVKDKIKDYIQLVSSGIQVRRCQIFDESKPKAEVLHKLKTDLHFDDSPIVVQECLNRKIPVVMISNGTTTFNKHLRNEVEHYPSLITALKAKNLIRSR